MVLRPEEMTVLQVGPSPTMLISLQKGWIDAAVVTSPTDFIAEESGYGILADLADMRLYTLQSTIAARREYLRSQEDQAVRFIKGYAEAVAYIAKNKNVAVDVLKKRLRMDATHDKHIEKTYQRYTSKYFDRVPYVSTLGVKTLLEFLENDNPKARGADPASFHRRTNRAEPSITVVFSKSYTNEIASKSSIANITAPSCSPAAGGDGSPVRRRRRT